MPAERGDAPPRIGIFADDLTGALDAAVPFAALGLRAFASPSLRVPKGDFDVLSVNMDSRRRGPTDAAESARRAVDLLAAWGATLLFNKIDSTMRGHPGLEALAAVRRGRADRVLLAPSFPATGRTVVHGVLSVDGAPLAETDVGRDALTPVVSSDVTEIVHAATGRRPGRANPASIRAGDRALGMPAGGSEVAVVDAANDADLDAIAAIGVADRAVLLAGSAGLAAAVARAFRKSAPRRSITPGAASPPFLIAVGSQREVAAAAVDALEEGGRAAVVRIETGSLKEALAGTFARDVAAHLASGRSVAIQLRAGDALAGGTPDQLAELRDRLVVFLGSVAREAARLHRPHALVVVGGDTALGVLSALEVAGIVLASEPIPGAAAGLIEGGPCSGIPVVTKAGAFGGEDSLVQICDWLSRGGKEA